MSTSWFFSFQELLIYGVDESVLTNGVGAKYNHVFEVPLSVIKLLGDAMPGHDPMRPAKAEYLGPLREEHLDRAPIRNEWRFWQE